MTTVNKNLKRGWRAVKNKVAELPISGRTYAGLPTDFTNDQLKGLWNELKSNYFDLGDDQSGISRHHGLTLGAFMDSHRNFVKSIDVVNKSIQLHDDAIRTTHKTQATRIYDLRSREELDTMSEYNANGNLGMEVVVQASNAGVGALDDLAKVPRFNSRGYRSALFLEALMSLEPLIDEAGKLRSVLGAVYDHQQEGAFDSEQKRYLYLRELGTSICKLIPDLKDIGASRANAQWKRAVEAPDMQLFIHWYLTSMANYHKHGVVMFKEKQPKQNVGICIEREYLQNSQDKWKKLDDSYLEKAKIYYKPRPSDSEPIPQGTTAAERAKAREEREERQQRADEEARDLMMVTIRPENMHNVRNAIHVSLHLLQHSCISRE